MRWSSVGRLRSDTGGGMKVMQDVFLSGETHMVVELIFMLLIESWFILSLEALFAH